MDTTVIEQELEAARAAASALAKRQVTMTWGFVVVLLVGLALLGGSVYLTMRSYEHALARAEVQMEKYDKGKEELTERLLESYKEREELGKQQKVIERVIENRDAQAKTAVQTVTAPDRSALATQKDVQNYYGFLPQFSGEAFQFTQPQVQTFVQTKIERDTFSADLADTRQQYELEKTKSGLLGDDLERTKGQLKEADATMKDLKKVAVKNRAQKVWDGVKTGLAVVGVADMVCRVAGGCR